MQVKKGIVESVQSNGSWRVAQTSPDTRTTDQFSCQSFTEKNKRDK